MQNNTRKCLQFARIVVKCAREIPGLNMTRSMRVTVVDHMGCALADASLQAGLDYFSVVLPRVQRIRVQFPHLDTVSSIKRELLSTPAVQLLQCKNSRKVGVFCGLVAFFETAGVDTINDMSEWCSKSQHRLLLQGIHGIGPKTADYLASLVGVDVVPVDRHILGMLQLAGLPKMSYNDSQRVFSYAADLLEIPRRSLDQVVWSHFARGFTRER